MAFCIIGLNRNPEAAQRIPAAASEYTAAQFGPHENATQTIRLFEQLRV
jgi:hypothetical protein